MLINIEDVEWERSFIYGGERFTCLCDGESEGVKCQHINGDINYLAWGTVVNLTRTRKELIDRIGDLRKEDGIFSMNGQPLDDLETDIVREMIWNNKLKEITGYAYVS